MRAEHSACCGEIEPGDAPTILMQTADEPDLTKLPHDYAEVQTRLIDGHIAALRAGQIVHYRVVLNPIRKSRTGGRNRQFVIPSRERVGWASDRLVSNGLDLEDPPAVTGLPARHITRSGRQFPIYSIRADGIGRVSDPELLNQAIKSGVGHAKAWGCGLITVLRAQDEPRADA